MSKKKILVVEDVKLVRSLLETRLEAEGYNVASVAIASEALHEVRKSMPDLIVLDLGLQDDDPFAAITDGFAFLSMLRRSYPGSDTSILIYSVSHSPEIEAKAKAMGVLEVIDKKRGVPALLEAVRKAFETREAA